jgi:hypothetical protein
MPTLQDVANQIKDDLDQIKSSTALTAARVDTLTQHLDTDEVSLGQGLFAIWEVEKQSAALLDDNVQQNETIICWLQTQADLQCRILRRLDTLIGIDTATRDAVVKLEKIMELVHAREALEVGRLDDVEAKVDACCPPQAPPPEPCYEPCREGKIQRYQPKGQDWQPPQGHDKIRAKG